MTLSSMKQSWKDLGGNHIWLSYAQMQTAPEPLIAVSTEGSRIRFADGHELLDCVASWWTACHGYNHPHILKTMKDQLECMPHVMFDGINHEPALKLARRLAALAPGDLDRVFFVDSGSVAVEVALKMAVQYWLNKGQKQRNKFLSFRNAYHGDTAACMALCDPDEGMHKKFDQYLTKQFSCELPTDYQRGEKMDQLLEREKQNIAAVIIEPLVQGAGGMRFHDIATLKRVADLCIKHGVLLIADEIFTGFGRTGTMFACEQAGVVPDIMCIGKAMTGGAVTLAATLARQHVFDAFLSDDPSKALMHGPTYMANPLACAAANASLDLFESQPRLQQVKAIEDAMRKGLEPCRSLPQVLDVHVLGAIGVVQFRKAPDHKLLRQQFIERGLWMRSWGDGIYLTPAFTITENDLAKMTSAICEIATTV